MAVMCVVGTNRTLEKGGYLSDRVDSFGVIICSHLVQKPVNPMFGGTSTPFDKLLDAGWTVIHYGVYLRTLANYDTA